MTENDWVGVHPDRGFRELLDAVANEGIEALNAFKHKQIELDGLDNAFYISQRILRETRDVLGESHPEFIGMLVNSIDGCLHAGKIELALRQAEYLRSLLEKAGDTSSDQYQYAVAAHGFCLAGLKRYALAIPVLEMVRTMQNDATVPEKVSTMMDLAAAYAGNGMIDKAREMCGGFNEQLLSWSREIASDPEGDAETAFSLCAYAIDVCMSVLIRVDENADPDWALNALLAYRGMLYWLEPAAATIHTPDGDVYRRARGALPKGSSFMDCVRFNDLLRDDIRDMLFFREGKGSIRYTLV